MEALEAIAKRTLTRKFKEIQISEEDLQAIFEYHRRYCNRDGY